MRKYLAVLIWLFAIAMFTTSTCEPTIGPNGAAQPAMTSGMRRG